MTSKIINMADRQKDAEDQLLESLFADSAIADDGFSQSVVRRIRRQVWVRRLALPVAILIGGGIALEPLMELASVGSQLGETAANIAPLPSIEVPESLASNLSMILGVAGFVIVGLFSIRFSET